MALRAILQIVRQERDRFVQLDRQRRVENVRRSQPLMNPARGRPDRSGDVFQKGDDVVVRALLDFRDLRNGEARPLSNFGRVLFRNLAELGHRLAGKQFDLKPDLELALVRPNVAHLRPGITIDHARKIEERAETRKCFVGKKNRSGEKFTGATSKVDYRCLA